MNWLNVVVTLALLAALAATLYQVLTQPGTVGDKLTTLERAARAAREIVAAAEQLYQTGNLTADERYDYVADLLSDLFPSLDSQAMRAAIEAAVHWRNLAAGDRAHTESPAMFSASGTITVPEQPRIDYGQIG
jgi:hypothetical protein